MGILLFVNAPITGALAVAHLSGTHLSLAALLILVLLIITRRIANGPG